MAQSESYSDEAQSHRTLMSEDEVLAALLEYEEGDEVTVVYESAYQQPSHMSDVGEATLTVESGMDDTYGLVGTTDSKEICVHHDGEVFHRSLADRRRGWERVKAGNVLDIQQ
jgi:hypothetical protein